MAETRNMVLGRNRNDESIFTEDQVRLAAEWWAKFLPAAQKIDSDVIDSNSKLEASTFRIFTALHDQMSFAEKMDLTKYNDFITILANKIRQLLPIKEWDSGLYYLQIGDSGSYEPPRIVEEAMEEAKFETNALGRFPFKTEMHIYDNGQILVGNEVLSSNPLLQFSDSDMNFDSAPLMKISGDAFRIVSCDLRELKGSLYTGFITNLDKFKSSQALNWDDDRNEEITHVFTKVKLNHFKGTEKEFLALDNNDWLEILQDKDKIKQYLNDLTGLYVKNEERCLRNTEYLYIGDVKVEKIGENYYQYVTEPVKILSVPLEGSVKDGSQLISVCPKDFLIKKRKGLSALPANSVLKDMFVAQFCDPNGTVISDTKYRPGDELPLAPLLETPRSLSMTR